LRAFQANFVGPYKLRTTNIRLVHYHMR